MAERITMGHFYPGVTPPVTGRKPTEQARPSASVPSRSFQDLLRDHVVKLSHHAEMRLGQRGLRIQPEQMAKIETAIDKAAAKGAKESLILMGDMAMIVNVKNKTIVTAMDGASMNDHVFTQIDSAIIIS
jgi:flagellar operon protein